MIWSNEMASNEELETMKTQFYTHLSEDAYKMNGADQSKFFNNAALYLVALMEATDYMGALKVYCTMGIINSIHTS